jgi:hypothetical protein
VHPVVWCDTLNQEVKENMAGIVLIFTDEQGEDHEFIQFEMPYVPRINESLQVQNGQGFLDTLWSSFDVRMERIRYSVIANSSGHPSNETVGIWIAPIADEDRETIQAIIRRNEA